MAEVRQSTDNKKANADAQRPVSPGCATDGATKHRQKVAGTLASHSGDDSDTHTHHLRAPLSLYLQRYVRLVGTRGKYSRTVCTNYYLR